MNVNCWAISGSLYFGINSVNNWRDFLKTNVSLWYEYLYAMMNRGVILAAPGPDEKWTVSTVPKIEEVNKNMEAFKEISESLKNVKSEVEIGDAE